MDTFEQFKLAKTAEGFDEVLARPWHLAVDCP